MHRCAPVLLRLKRSGLSYDIAETSNLDVTGGVANDSFDNELC